MLALGSGECKLNSAPEAGDPLGPVELPDNVHVTVIAGAGHYPHLTHPTQLHEVLTSHQPTHGTYT